MKQLSNRSYASNLRFSRQWRFKSWTLGCNAVYWCGRIPTFRKTILPPSLVWRWKQYGRKTTFWRTMLPPLSHWRWKLHGFPKRWCPTTKLHGVTIRKSTIWN